MLKLPKIALSLSCAPSVEVAGTCARDADCSDGARCVADLAATHVDRSPLPLTCGAAWGDGKARDRCASAQDCQSGLCALADVCLAPCVESSDCPRGQLCRPVEARWKDGLEPVQACTRVFAFSDDVKLARRPRQASLPGGDLSTLNTGAAPGDAIVFLKSDCGATAEIRQLRASKSEAVLFDLATLLDGKGSPNPVVNSGGFVPFLVPNNPTIAASPEGYAFDVSFDVASAAELVTAARAGEHTILDFNLFLVGGGQEVDPSGLHPGSAAVRDLMTRMDDRFRKVGMRVGTVREHDVTGALRDELGVIETRPITDANGNLVDLEVEGLDALFELSAGLDDGGLNLFLVSDMGDLLGISGGIPGSIGAHGTSMSGVAVAVDTVGLDAVDAVIQHEVAHQLGLFHTSEINGFVIEPLSDTPACELDRDDDGDFVLASSECRDAGADNLMFWAGTGSELSPQQIEVLQRSPVLR